MRGAAGGSCTAEWKPASLQAGTGCPAPGLTGPELPGRACLQSCPCSPALASHSCRAALKQMHHCLISSPALGDLGLVGRVLSVPAGVLQQVAQDDGGQVGVVVAHADEGLGHLQVLKCWVRVASFTPSTCRAHVPCVGTHADRRVPPTPVEMTTARILLHPAHFKHAPQPVTVAPCSCSPSP